MAARLLPRKTRLLRVSRLFAVGEQPTSAGADRVEPKLARRAHECRGERRECAPHPERRAQPRG